MRAMDTNATPQAQVRRLQDTLAITGGGVFAFGAWTFVKTFLFMVLFDEKTVRAIFYVGDDVPILVIYLGAALVLAVDLGLRAYVGFSARAEAHGKRRGWGYLVAAIFAALGIVAGIVFSSFEPINAFSPLDNIVSAVIDLTSLVTLVVMVATAVRLRRLTEQKG